MSGKRSFLGGMVENAKKQRPSHSHSSSHKNNTPKSPFLSRPILQEVAALRIFLLQARSAARQHASSSSNLSLPATQPFCEIEARIGILKSDVYGQTKRVLSSGPKRLNIQGATRIVHAFNCTQSSPATACRFEGGITRTHFVNWTASGLSEVSPLSQAFGAKDSNVIKRDVVEKEMVETVFGGYQHNYRACFDGDHVNVNQNTGNGSSGNQKPGKMEHKSKLITYDMALPSSPYDLRINLSTEETMDSNLSLPPPSGWTTKRLKRRKSYMRRDNSIKWQLDVTEVISTNPHDNSTDISYEIEFELNPITTLKLINEKDDAKVRDLCNSLASQLHWMIGQINPSSDVLDVEEFLVDHPNTKAVSLALAQCASLKKFAQDKDHHSWKSAIAERGGGVDSTPKVSSYANLKFPGCMPVNFQRHNIEEVQRSDADGGYFLSEKTDGVRHFMIFTGDAVILVDRAMKGKMIDPPKKNSKSNATGFEDPMKHIIPLIKPGTVFDGEVVMRRSNPQRPVFIVFDVLALSASQPVLHLPFAQRLQHLKRASFRTESANRDMFAEKDVLNPDIPLPLVRKNFVKRIETDTLLSHVVEEKGLRSYKNGIHDHLTDGIIFQPNLPYVCGTDVHLLKWKYLDTVTIDVQIMPPPMHNYNNQFDEDTLHVAVTGEDGSMVDMTRFIRLPSSERHRLEADRDETGARIAEVGFEPTTGEWYYLTMRPDKTGPNHISTVIGTMLELAESLSTEELRYRMSVPSSGRDTYRKDMRNMQKQLLDHQRKKNMASRRNA